MVKATAVEIVRVIVVLSNEATIIIDPDWTTWVGAHGAETFSLSTKRFQAEVSELKEKKNAERRDP